MDVLLFFIGPLIGVIIASTIMKIIYKDTEKKDEGFVLNYHKLSYRRKFLRSLWGVPFGLLAYLFVLWLGHLTSSEYQLIGAAFLLIVITDITYHYVKWTKNEKEA